MQVQATDYYFQLTDRVELYVDANGQLRIDGQLVLAARPISEQIMLITEGGNHYCVPRTAYILAHQETTTNTYIRSELAEAAEHPPHPTEN